MFTAQIPAWHQSTHCYVHLHDVPDALGDGSQPHIQNSKQKYLNTQVSKKDSPGLVWTPFKDVEHLEFFCAFVRPYFSLTDNSLWLLCSKKEQSKEGQRIYSTELSIMCWCQEESGAISDKKEVFILNSCECTFCDLLLKSNSRVIHRLWVTRWVWVINP